MDDLRKLAQDYSTLAIRIDANHKTAYNDREQRQSPELHIIDLMKTPEFSSVRNFQHGGFVFKVDPPGTWKDSWHLSRKDLELDLVGYWNSTDSTSAQKCFEYVCTQHNLRARDTDWRLSWTHPAGNR